MKILENRSEGDKVIGETSQKFGTEGFRNRGKIFKARKKFLKWFQNACLPLNCQNKKNASKIIQKFLL